MDLCHLCHIFVILIGGRVTISQVVALVDVVTREIEVTFPILKQYYTAEPPTASIPASSSIQRPSQIADSDRSSLFLSNTMGFWLTEYRKYRLSKGCEGGFHGTALALASARDGGSPVRQGMAAQIDQRGRMIDLLREEFRKPNSKDCYRSKIFEWFEYRDYVAPLTDESVRYHVKFEHVFDFVFYTCFREKREKKDCNKRKRNAGDYLYFVPDDYENIIATKGIEHSRGEPISEPKDGIQYSFFEQLRSCMLFLHKEQITLKTTSISWAEIWTDRLEAIGKLVQTRKRRQDRNNFSEKVDVATAPYTVLEKIKLVEKWFWDHASFTNDRRTAFAAFRARYMFLRTRQAILRGESVILEEFSDFLGVEIKCAKDPHTMEIFVSQISQGKTNGIYKLFGCSCRHRDVFQCAYSALGMWLA